jgi:hypothetical protein
VPGITIEIEHDIQQNTDYQNDRINAVVLQLEFAPWTKVMITHQISQHKGKKKSCDIKQKQNTPLYPF